jgi:hypothetical protein
MSDLFREIDEEVRRDKLVDFWNAYSNWIIGAAILIVVGVGGWRYQEHRTLQAAEAASARIELALKDAREGRGEEAEKALGEIAKDAPTGYKMLARFRAAGEAGKRDAAEGSKQFDALAADSALEAGFRDLARLRAVMLRLDEMSFAEVRPVLEPMAAPTGIWRHTAREILGAAALKANDFDAAARWFDQIASDRETPAGLRQRADQYLAIVSAGPTAPKP